MRMSKNATAVMHYLAEQFLISGDGRYQTWTFTPDDGDPSTAELRNLGLIKPFALGGMHVLTARGHQWIMDNRKLEGDVSEDEFFYPDIFIINGHEHMGQRDDKDKVVLIPCSEDLPIAIGSTFEQKSGGGAIVLKVIDRSLRRDLEDGGRFILSLTVRNLTAEEHQAAPAASSFHIGQIAGTGIQVGNQNQQNVTMSLQHFVQEMVKKDPETKNLLLKILESRAAAAVLGAGAQALITVLTGKPPGHS